VSKGTKRLSAAPGLDKVLGRLDIDGVLCGERSAITPIRGIAAGSLAGLL
jgi:hypothetical protein